MGWVPSKGPCQLSCRNILRGALPCRLVRCHPAAAQKSEMKTASASPELNLFNQGYGPGQKPQGLPAKRAMLMPLNYWLLVRLCSSMRESLRTLARAMRRIPQRRTTGQGQSARRSTSVVTLTATHSKTAVAVPQDVRRTQRPGEGTRLEFRMNSRYQPGGARLECGGSSMSNVPAPMPLITSSMPRCDML